MPEITDAEFRNFMRYQALGTPQDVEKKIADLESDNRDQREEIRTMKDTLPKEGEVVVKKTTADRLGKYEELGKPDEIEGKLKEGDEAKVKLAGRLQREAATSFADAVGLAEETVDTLVALPELQGATFTVVDGKVKNDKGEEVDGKIGKITVTVDDAETTLDFDAARERFPALKGLKMADPNDKRPDKNFVQQGHDKSGGPAEGNLYDKIRESREKEAKEQEKTASKPLEERLGMASSA